MRKLGRSSQSFVLLLVIGACAFYGVTRWQRRLPPAPSLMVPSHWVSVAGGLKQSPQFTAYGRLVAVTGGEYAHFYNAATGGLVREWPLSRQTGSPLGFWVSQNGTRAIEAFEQESRAGGVDTFSSLYTVFDALTGRTLKQGRLSGAIKQISFESGLCLTIDPKYLNTQPSHAHPGGSALLSSSVRLYDFLSGRLVKKFDAPKGDDIYGTLVQQGRSIFIRGRLLRLSDGKEILSLPSLYNPTFSQDNKRLLGCRNNGEIQIWDLATRKHTTIKTGLIRLWWASELSNGLLLVYGGKMPQERARRQRGAYDAVLQVRVGDGTLMSQEYKAEAEVNGAAAYGMKGRLAAFRVYETVDEANKRPHEEVPLPKIDVFDLERGKRLCRLDTAHDSQGIVNIETLDQQSLALSPDGRQAVVLTQGGLLRFFDLPVI